MKRFLQACMLTACIAVLLLPGTALAEDAIGWVSKTDGTASIHTPGQDARPANIKGSILAEDTLKTGADGSMQVVFQDETILALGADSQLVVMDTLTREADGLFHLQLVQGASRLLTSEIARANPDKFKLESPLGTIGIRGTEFGVRVLPDRSTVLLYEGGPVLFASTEGGDAAGNAEACTKLAKALKDAEMTHTSAKKKMKGAIKSKMKRRISEIQDLQAQIGCTP